jgi:hypothetical protein
MKQHAPLLPRERVFYERACGGRENNIVPKYYFITRFIIYNINNNRHWCCTIADRLQFYNISK